MGANHSSGAGHNGNASPAAGELKVSYYELLGVERTASDEEIKKAYRKKALELHPDRNYDDVERTTALFAEVQVAYEILSDKNERAWYDAHERDILRGGDAGGEAHYEHDMRVTTSEDIARMLRKFHGGIDFSDAPSGFFGFLRDTFVTLAREEEAAADWESTDVLDYPSFGHKDDSYEGVVQPFYATWASFSTKKSFAWMDLYRYSEAPDRRVRRMMEKENKRLRDAGIRDFNDAVRTLVAFVRKRDPRYTPHTQTVEEREKTLRDAARAQAARQKAANAAKIQGKVPDWATSRNAEDEEDEVEEESDEEQYECVACHKTFKSERQYDAHEKSKKHQKAVQALKRQMQKDNRHLNLDDDISGSGANTPTSMDGADKVVTVEKDGAEEVTHELGELDVDDEGSEVTQDNQEEDQKFVKSSTPHSESSDDEDDEYASRSEIEDRLGGSESLASSATLIDPLATDPLKESSQPKLGKAAQKRAKKAAQQAAIDQSDLQFKCAVCNVGFSSRTRMFQHIKDFGHAAPPQKTGKGGRKI
ncbi:DnaJ-domain-containing protein [Mytilinidion resinicola]|uniref:DnaJ-domain-containing protein n=1 Tax=Mytilinidion resinicola TaxID=574789 RepID=A0A6A6YYP5_9PEZI|nr:DnaJ-domain-containing protein [Mytilinidion resinicola]KAF2813880.1 DnaJ-domain-containing protein [Mytilinidion resinicola]